MCINVLAHIPYVGVLLCACVYVCLLDFPSEWAVIPHRRAYCVSFFSLTPDSQPCCDPTLLFDWPKPVNLEARKEDVRGKEQLPGAAHLNRQQLIKHHSITQAFTQTPLSADWVRNQGRSSHSVLRMLQLSCVHSGTCSKKCPTHLTPSINEAHRLVCFPNGLCWLAKYCACCEYFLHIILMLVNICFFHHFACCQLACLCQKMLWWESWSWQLFWLQGQNFKSFLLLLYSVFPLVSLKIHLQFCLLISFATDYNNYKHPCLARSQCCWLWQLANWKTKN